MRPTESKKHQTIRTRVEGQLTVDAVPRTEGHGVGDEKSGVNFFFQEATLRTHKKKTSARRRFQCSLWAALAKNTMNFLNKIGTLLGAAPRRTSVGKDKRGNEFYTVPHPREGTVRKFRCYSFIPNLSNHFCLR